MNLYQQYGSSNLNDSKFEIGMAALVIQYVNLYQQSGLSNLNGSKFEKGMAALFIQNGKG